MDISNEQIVAMAVAAIAEETKEEIENIRVIYFREIVPSSLETYLRRNHITFRKYQLGDESA
ncbi:MAG: hypothetical protein Q4F41_09835 [Eubacteriales bacterium]|nr:hypothetical protein [Eubacteriales bacterium]